MKQAADSGIHSSIVLRVRESMESFKRDDHVGVYTTLDERTLSKEKAER
jgi:hypothetical protein